MPTQRLNQEEAIDFNCNEEDRVIDLQSERQKLMRFEHRGPLV